MEREIEAVIGVATIGADELEAATWSDPEPIPDTLLSVPPMVPEMLPGPLLGWLRDVAERMQCPLEFPAAAVVVALASLVGSSVRIRPKRRNDWTVTPNMWGMLIGRPSSYKSPSLGEALKPLVRLEAQAKEAHEAASKEHEFELMAAKARADELRDKLKKATKKGGDIEALRYEFQSDTEPETPTRRRYLANDPTVEAVGVLLNENPRGILLYRDELAGFFHGLERAGHEADRAFYLEAWNGDKRYTYDRIGRGTIDIESATLSILGGIQPSKLLGYLDAAVSGGFGDDGLIQRFQLMVYPDLPEEWRDVDRYPDAQAKERAFAIFDRLASLDPATFAERDGEDGPHFLRFDDEAQDFFNEWQADLMNRVRLESPAMESHLAKFPSLLPSLALTFHLIDLVDGSAAEARVSLGATELAAAWCDYLEAHARRVYGSIADGGYARAKELAKHIEQGDLASPFTLRDVQRKGWRLLGELEQVREAVETLEEFGWVAADRRQVADPLGRGRRTVDYRINPKAIKEARA